MSNPLYAALEVLAPVLDSKDKDQAVVAAKIVGLVYGYDAKWRNAPFRIDDVEAVLTADLYNPETGRKSRTFTTAGKLDVRCTEINTGQKVLIDHKTTSEGIDDLNSPYWRQLVVEGQASHYMLLEWLNGEKVDAALWDVVRKPMIQPRALTKLEQAGLFNFGNYFETKFDADEIERVKYNTRDKEKGEPAVVETPKLYAARLAFDTSQTRPYWYYQRRMVPRLDGEVREYASDQWDIGQDMIHARANNRHPRNSGACMLYHSPCKFLGVCSGYDTIDSEKWTRKKWVHPELPIIGQSNGLEVLTNSRMRMFQTCKRKHYYTYELGVEKIDEEERETLFFGNLYHAALEQFYLSIKKEQQKAA